MISFPRFTQMSYFGIWAPRWHDRKVLLSCSKVGTHNKVVFLKASSLGEEPYYVSGKTIKKYPKTSNGSIQCYAVPLDELQLLELTRDMREVM